MSYRDKIISLRVNQNLYRKVLEIIEKNTRVSVTAKTKNYFNSLKGKYINGMDYYRKFSVADLFEIAMKEFIKDNS